MKKRFGTASLILLVLLVFSLSAGLAEKTILMTFTGDCTLGSEETKRRNANSFDTFAKEKGYDYFFANFKDLFEADDLTVVNLEGVLSDNAGQENTKKTFRFRGPTDFAKILTCSSIEAVSTANNHIMDYGSQGEKNTRKALEEHGVAWFRGESFYVYEHDGIRIAFVAIDNRLYYQMRSTMGATFRKMKEAEGISAIVVCVHTGIEYNGKHDSDATDLANFLIGNGADLLIMHHPHVLQGMEIINRRNVFYSMGNFVFGGNCEIKANKKNSIVNSLYTMAVQVKMTFTNDGQYLGQQAVIYPANISDDPVANHYQPVRLSAADAAPVVEALQRDTAFRLPAVTEKNGLSVIEFPYIPDTDETMIPEDEPDE